ncbi:lactate utilization protein C [Pelosinus sp. sgz500959]|uniref:LutC/YkgG family protein n=1 Tax=Pelosinus sp. sgz500959 TaxID=3242472 RepID=UPI00366DC57A
MKKVCENWRNAFPLENVGDHLFPEFEKRASAAATEIFRVKTAVEAREIVANMVKFTNAKKIVTVNSPLQQATGINEELHSMGISVYTELTDITEHAESADIGISTVEFGIAESGSVCMDGYAFESRLVSMLPPIHVVFMNSKNVVLGITEAFEVISKVYDNGYISFITGPSRTSDIERVLTIGVHGPNRFVLIAIDEEVSGGAL